MFLLLSLQDIPEINILISGNIKEGIVTRLLNNIIKISPKKILSLGTVNTIILYVPIILYLFFLNC
jgi:hypothetical protein